MKKEKCFDIGTIQAFIDGELASGLSEKVIKHIALCESCAMQLAETEEENSFAFSVLDEGLNCLVPTERLRTKVLDSIREIEQTEKPSWWENLTKGLGFANGLSFRSPGFAAFASLVLFVSALAVGMNFYNTTPQTTDVAFSTPQVEPLEINDIPVSDVEISNEDENSDVIPVKEIESIKAVDTGESIDRKSNSPKVIRPQKADYRPENTGKKSSINKAVPKTPKSIPALTEERGYLQTIATLKRSVDGNKDIVLRPTERIAYERDLALVNDAISKMKAEVRRNPNNHAAKEVLRDSYKNKIDLLNSVAEKTELMASVQ